MSDRYTTEAIEPIVSTQSRKVKEAQQIAENLPLPLIKPLLFQAADVLKPSAQIVSSPLASERPKLVPPEAASSRSLSDFRYLKEMDLMKTCSNTITESRLERFNVSKHHIQNLKDKHIEKIEENAAKASTSHWWSMLTKAATGLLSALSLALGLSVLAGGGSALVGGALIASGVLSLTNFVCTEANVWNELAKKLAENDEERRKKIGMILPIALGVLSAGLGLFGGLHNMAHASNFLTSNVLSLLQTALTAFQGATTIGQAISQGKVTQTQADLTGIKDAMNEERILLQVISSWIENFMAEIKGINQKASQAISMVIQANQKMVQA